MNVFLFKKTSKVTSRKTSYEP